MPRQARLSLDEYDCIGFDLDHTLCRYNVGNLAKLVYDLLADYLIKIKGYDRAIKNRQFEDDIHLLAKGLTLDCDKGNLLRLGCDGVVLAASHGTRKLTDFEIEKEYGRDRRKHPGTDYIQHLKEFGPQRLVEFSPLLHSFMDYFDLAAPLLCARIVDVLDIIYNKGKPLTEYNFWPDVHEGLKDLYLRTHFASNLGGFFPAIKANPELYIIKRSPEFRSWLRMLRSNGKFLYVITGSHYDFASHVASYAIGDDWKDLFDIVIFFARKPSFFVEKRPFFRLDGAVEKESFRGWEDLETGECYSQGNWKDLNEFFEYCTEWEPTTSLYFGDNVLQDVLAPKRFTSTIDSVAISEEMIAEGMHNKEALDEHPDKELMVSDFWGSYFYYPKSTTSKLTKTPSFRKLSASVTASSGPTGRSTPAGCPTTPGLRRASSMRSTEDLRKTTESNSITVSATIEIKPTPEPVVGPMKINTLWGQLIATNARMCIPDLQFLVEYPIDYQFPSFACTKKGQIVSSGFWPADPKSLHEKSSS